MNRSLRILIVEDDELIGLDLAELLIGLGHEVCAIVGSALAAETAAARHQPDLMIVDAHLDGSSGLVAMSHILAIGFVPHFYVTGDARAVRIQAPGSIVIAKPYSLRELETGIAGARAAGRL